MKFVHVAACAAVALAPVLLGCSSSDQQAPPPRTGVTSAQAQPEEQHLTAQQRAREALLAADLEIRDLQQMSKATSDMEQREAIGRQIAVIRVRRDALLADMSASNGRADDPRVHASLTNLERAMRSAAAAQPQAPAAPTLEQQLPPPGDDEAYPPSR